jgi:hypothetical protein
VDAASIVALAALPTDTAACCAATNAASGPAAHALAGTAITEVTVCATRPLSVSDTPRPSTEGKGVTPRDTIAPSVVVPVAYHVVPPGTCTAVRATVAGSTPNDATADAAHTRARELATSASANAPSSERKTVAFALNAEVTFLETDTSAVDASTLGAAERDGVDDCSGTNGVRSCVDN